MIKIVPQKRLVWENAISFDVSCYPWGGDYCPKTTAKLLLLQDEGLHILMTCWEKTPKTSYYSHGDPVHKDSCMECFIKFLPDKDFGYINLECNSAGTLYAAYGKSRNDRTMLRNIVKNGFSVEVSHTKDSWRVHFFIHKEIVKNIYGDSALEPGSEMAVNFYKCGDETSFPHYVSWRPIDTKNPDFHRPEYFGRIRIS